MVKSEKTPDDIPKEGPILVASIPMDCDTTAIEPEKGILDMMADSASGKPPLLADAVARILTPRAIYTHDIGNADAFLYMLKDIDDYAKNGEVNLIASFYRENAGTIEGNKVLNSLFKGALKKALRVCANEGNLASLSELMGAGIPAPISKAATPAASRAMRVCIRKKDVHSITSFLQKEGMPEKACSMGIEFLAGMRMFPQIGELLRQNVLWGDALGKAQEAHSHHIRSLEKEHREFLAAFRMKEAMRNPGPQVKGSTKPSRPISFSSNMPNVPRRHLTPPRFVAGVARNRK